MNEFDNYLLRVTSELYKIYNTREINKAHLEHYIKYREAPLKRLLDTNDGHILSDKLGCFAVRKYCDEGMTAQMHAKGFIYFDHDPVPQRDHNHYRDVARSLLNDALELGELTPDLYVQYWKALTLVQNVVMFKHPHYVGEDLLNYTMDYVNLGFIP